MGRFDIEEPKEETPLIPKEKQEPTKPITCHESLFNFLEAKTKLGLSYEYFTITLILLNVASFILGSLYIPKYNKNMNKYYDCDELCDALWFGNMEYNSYLDWIDIGPTSVLELVTVFVFSVDYLLRIWTADLIDDRYSGFCGMLLKYFQCKPSCFKLFVLLYCRSDIILANLLLPRRYNLHSPILYRRSIDRNKFIFIPVPTYISSLTYDESRRTSLQ